MPDPKLNLPDTGPLRHRLPDGRLNAPSAERNFDPIKSVLSPHVPETGRALEIASGTGQHIAALAAGFPSVAWQPSDLDTTRSESILAWKAHFGADNLLDPMVLDASAPWPDGLDDLDLVLLVNLFHLIQPDQVQAVLAGVSAALKRGGVFFLYGPFRTEGGFRSAGDEQFDASLRAQNARIGYKDLEWVQESAAGCGLGCDSVVEMPANNLAVLFRPL